jgi:phosphopantetheinyl transferase
MRLKLLQKHHLNGMNKPVIAIIGQFSTPITRQLSRQFQQNCLALTLQCSVSELVFDRPKQKKPVLLSHPNTHFSVSHTQNIAIICIHNQPIGCDIESQSRLVSHNVFNRAQSNPNDWDHILGDSTASIVHWTRWEAICKAKGTGLRFPIQLVGLDACQTFSWHEWMISVACQHSSLIVWHCLKHPEKTDPMFADTRLPLPAIDAPSAIDLTAQFEPLGALTSG